MSLGRTLIRAASQPPRIQRWRDRTGMTAQGGVVRSRFSRDSTSAQSARQVARSISGSADTGLSHLPRVLSSSRCRKSTRKVIGSQAPRSVLIARVSSAWTTRSPLVWWPVSSREVVRQANSEYHAIDFNGQSSRAAHMRSKSTTSIHL